MGLVAKADRGWKTLADVIDAARQGKKISVGAMSAKLADGLYVIGKANDVKFTTVMVKGGKGGLNGVIAGDLDMAWVAGPQSKGVRSGDLVNLVSAEGSSLSVSPDAPLLSKFGVDFTFGSKFGVIAPAGLDPKAREVLQKAIVDIVADPKSKLNKLISRAFSGPEPIAGADFDAYIQAAHKEADKLLKFSSE